MSLQPVNLNGDVGVRPLVVAVIFIVLATVSVVLRYVSRRMMKAPLAADDYLICLALFFSYALTICNIIGIVYGAEGLHIRHVLNSQVTVFLKNLLPSIMLWASALTTVKLSLLLLYVRIFVIRPFCIAAYILMAVVVVWWMSVILEEFLLCRPFAFNWDPTIQGGVCGNREAAYLAAGIINLCTDVIILCLPMPMVWRLKLPRRNKIALSIVFGVGFFVCVITIFRLKAVLAFRQADPTYTIWSTVMWSEMEPTLGIICTCAPMMRPIFDKLFAQYRAKRTIGPSSGGYSGLRPSRDAQDSNEHSYPLTALKTHTVIRANNPTGDNLAWHSDLEDSRHHENIRVDSDWEVHHFRV